MEVEAFNIEPPSPGPDQQVVEIEMNIESPVRFAQRRPLRPGDLVRWRCTVRSRPADFEIHPGSGMNLPVSSPHGDILIGTNGRTPIVAVTARPGSPEWRHYRVVVKNPPREEMAGILITPAFLADGEDYPPYLPPSP